MSARGFRSVFMVASCAGAALSCYMVSLRVASERAALQEVESEIVDVQQDIRLLQTEIGTRARLGQLERWNVRVLSLSAPSADQFLEGGFALARLMKPEPVPQIEAPVVLASAPAPQPQHAPLEEGERRDGGAGATSTPAGLLREASLELPARETAAASKEKPAPRTVARLDKKAGDKKAKASQPPVTRPVRTATIDPLAPLPPGSGSSATGKETGPAR